MQDSSADKNRNKLTSLSEKIGSLSHKSSPIKQSERLDTALRLKIRNNLYGECAILRDSLVITLENGQVDPARAEKMIGNCQRRQVRADVFCSDNCHLDWRSYLEKSKFHRPPRPKQAHIAITAARYAGLMTLFGQSATGKTTAAVRCAVLRSIIDTDAGALAISGMRLSRMQTSERADFVSLAIRHEGTLLLDDIDKGSKAEGVSSALLEIVEAREHAIHSLTILTTNVRGKQLNAKLFNGYGDPIVNRLSRGIAIDFDPIEVDAGGLLKEIRMIIGRNCPVHIGERLGNGRIR